MIGTTIAPISRRSKIILKIQWTPIRLNQIVHHSIYIPHSRAFHRITYLKSHKMLCRNSQISIKPSARDFMGIGRLWNNNGILRTQPCKLPVSQHKTNIADITIAPTQLLSCRTIIIHTIPSHQPTAKIVNRKTVWKIIKRPVRMVV